MKQTNNRVYIGKVRNCLNRAREDEQKRPVIVDSAMKAHGFGGREDFVFVDNWKELPDAAEISQIILTQKIAAGVKLNNQK